LGDREARNIFKIKIDEIVSDLPEILREKVVLLKVLNSFSFRSISFIAPVKGEGFINLFFRFLDSSGKSAEMP
jgi:hypothetical protein